MTAPHRIADPAVPDPLCAARAALRAGTLADETALTRDLAAAAALSAADRDAICAAAAGLVRDLRDGGGAGLLERFLAEYGLSTSEGVALMRLAEAMLRAPDAPTVDALIRDKIAARDWAAHLGGSGSSLVDASTLGLMLTGKLLEDEAPGPGGALHGMIRRLGAPAVRAAMGRAMAEMGSQFVLGRTMDEALRRGAPAMKDGFTHSFDMLGEAARTEADARGYFDAYAGAVRDIAAAATHGDVHDNPGVSVKLSALHPRYEALQAGRAIPALTERLLLLARAAKAAGIGLSVDAEEADRLDLSLDVIAATLSDPSLKGWAGFGVVVQAYGRRAVPTLDWLHALAEGLDRRIAVRLVKGAYWDAEIKRAQVLGLQGFPVFTRKAHTDVSYLACARRMLGMTDRIRPQFATHNAHTVAAILHMAENRTDAFEFQRLHGMGEGLHRRVRDRFGARCRIYAPVGAHRDLLAYLVRRLLENGANGSFVHQIADPAVPPETVARDPIAAAEAGGFAPDPAIAPPPALFGARANSRGIDLNDPAEMARLEAARAPFAAPRRWGAAPSFPSGGPSRIVTDPATGAAVGEVQDAAPEDAATAVTLARRAQPSWEAQGPAARAAILRRAADLFEANGPEFLALLTREAGKTLADGVAELREAVDFLRYYADGAAALTAPARGVVACISPWNFPLAIFTGQIAAALAAGAAAIAKPAEQTPLVAARACALLHEAGVPENALILLPGDAAIGAPLTADPRLGGVCFTGSTEVARLIDRQLAQTAPDAMLIAETGGLNAMVVDSTALIEQAVRDIIRGAFQSAGQRCSALRMLYVQTDVAEELMTMLQGAAEALQLGDPWDPATDVGPVIDAEARSAILSHLDAHQGRIAFRLPVPETAPEAGRFVGPAVIRVDGIADLEREVFGPILHVATFAAGELDAVTEAVNARGYGLTFGLHTRIDRRMQRIADAAHVGNVYVNRDQIGAVVGSQPFGGHGLSGTGPKAGGPFYLARFTAEDGQGAPNAVQDAAPNLAPHLAPAAPGGDAADAAPAPAALPAATIAAALQALRASPERPAWAARQDRPLILRALLRGRAAAAMSAAAALDHGPRDLPGPTGEANRLSLLPRGVALCLGPTPEALLDQSVQALAAGNAVLAVGPGAAAALAPLCAESALPLTALDGICPAEALGDAPLDLAAFEGPGAAPLRRALAGRDGPILPLVRARLSPAAYALEKTVCIDTTAAGGDAALLAAAG